MLTRGLARGLIAGFRALHDPRHCLSCTRGRDSSLPVRRWRRWKIIVGILILDGLFDL
jgi:hypothetical protein